VTQQVLWESALRSSAPGLSWPEPTEPSRRPTDEGMLLDARQAQMAADESVSFAGPGVHTRNGDSVEWIFALPDGPAGQAAFGFAGGYEFADVVLDLARGEARIETSDWSSPQPAAVAPLALNEGSRHVLTLHKREGTGDLVKMADVKVILDGELLIAAEGLNVLPEMGVQARASGCRLLLRHLLQRGEPWRVPEYLLVGAWQMLNLPDVDANLASLKRGLRLAAELGIELLLTPETSITGLFPTDAVTWDRACISEAEGELRRFMSSLQDAPYLVAGLPVWERASGHGRGETRYNASRLYAPDGAIISTHAKAHSCEREFWHGYGLHEFDVNGVPATLHICHDARYPNAWLLPVMFGARLILHPANGGRFRGNISAFERHALRSSFTSHAFYVNATGGGASYIVGPGFGPDLLVASENCGRDVETYPEIGSTVECMVSHRIRVHDAYGYWPVRDFRASEDQARAYKELYRTMGGKHA